MYSTGNLSKHHRTRQGERGNVLIYVLIAIALFAALSFTLSRQASNTGGQNNLSEEKAELYASQLISYAAQAKNAVEQLTFEGSTIDEIDFVTPSDSDFETGSDIRKVYHPGGAALSPGIIPEQLEAQVNSNPAAGWYMGRFNNVEWTDSSATDIILTAHQISRTACEQINEKITGNATIPALNVNPALVLIDENEHSGTNQDFNISNCAACEGFPSLCVSDSGATLFSFYNILIAR